MHKFTCCFAFADVADLSDGDNFYLHCFVGDRWDEGGVERS